MIKQMNARHAALVLGAAAMAAVFSGCATFPNSEVAVVNAFPKLAEGNSRPSVFVPKNSHGGLWVMRKKEIANILNASGLFGKVSYDPQDLDALDYTLSVELRRQRSFYFAWYMATVLSLHIIPSRETNHYTQVVTLKDLSGNVIASTSNKDSVSTWIGIWFIPWCFNTWTGAVSQTLDNQVKAALLELANNGYLQ